MCCSSVVGNHWENSCSSGTRAVFAGFYNTRFYCEMHRLFRLICVGNQSSCCLKPLKHNSDSVPLRLFIKSVPPPRVDPPTVTLSIEPRSVLEGERVTFTCQATGNPPIIGFRSGSHFTRISL